MESNFNRFTKTNFDTKALIKASTNGSSELMSNISLSIVSILYNLQLMNLVGGDGVAAYGVIMYVNFIFLAVFIGFVIGAAPIFGFNHGADNREEMKNMFRKSLVLLGIFAILMTSAALILAKPLATIFVGYDAALMEMTVRGFIIYSLSFLLSGFNFFGSSMFTALNNGLVSAAISLLRTFVFQSAAVLVLLFYQLGEWFEGFAVARSRRSIARLMDIRPDTANLETEAGLEEVDPEDVSVGDVIHPGDLIAYDGSKEIISDAYGLIREISLGNDPYLRLCSLEDLALECYVNDTQRAILQRSSLELLDEDGTALTLLDMDEIYTNGNSTRVLLRYDAENLRYGQTFSDLILSTGKVYSQALVVDERCVYKKPDTDSYYLRLVDQDGHFISETEVKVGYSDGTYICVSGIEEGTLCDSGYKTLAEEHHAGT